MTEQEKQELAEWLAVEVLGIKFRPKAETFGVRKNEDFSGYTVQSTESYLRSPDGFFAVWDVAEKRLFWQISFCDSSTDKVSLVTCWIYHRPSCNEIRTFYVGKDRYEAFYKAVKQAWEGKEGLVFW